MKFGVQQIMLGTVTKTETQALDTLKQIKSFGYDGIELNGFMIRPSSMMVRLLTKAAGMPTGNGGKYNWEFLVKEAGLEVISLHEDLGTIERDIGSVIEEAKKFHTNKIVITGMYRFDYSDEKEVATLCERLNSAGEKLQKEHLSLLYHNHNVEFQKLKGKTLSPEDDFLDLTSYGMIVKETDANLVNFEMDSYWIADAGIDPLWVMKYLGERLKLYHINDRGNRKNGIAMTPIIGQDSLELGTGNMNLNALVRQAMDVNVDGIILESHRNFIDKDPIESIRVSGNYLNQWK